MGSWDRWIEKVGSHAGNRNMELRMESCPKQGRAGYPVWTRQASKWYQDSLHRACALNSKLYLAHLGEKAQEWP